MHNCLHCSLHLELPSGLLWYRVHGQRQHIDNTLSGIFFDVGRLIQLAVLMM